MAHSRVHNAVKEPFTGIFTSGFTRGDKFPRSRAGTRVYASHPFVGGKRISQLRTLLYFFASFFFFNDVEATANGRSLPARSLAESYKGSAFRNEGI